ncbi:polysaccharide biosynthesis C-terminal domain-containing protein, partial [Candidatus Woesearchaeota archaeon]|nr:polysaccharide biosynthesis C-terminal domain-containing protein [Candidatus Woesearchaeota archaeon]
SIFYTLSTSILPLINAFDLVLFSQFFNLVKAIVNIVGDFILVPKMGIIGAAYATLLSYIVGLGLSLLLIYFKKRRIFGAKHETPK